MKIKIGLAKSSPQSNGIWTEWNEQQQQQQQPWGRRRGETNMYTLIFIILLISVYFAFVSLLDS